jgi:hypothetical protein
VDVNESRLKISNPPRVGRILRRICQASLQVMLRCKAQSGVAVKGRASTLSEELNTKVIRISNISDKGMEHLAPNNRVQVEFIMMSTKVVFVSVIVAREQNSLLVKAPDALISIERRKNARYGTASNLSAFLSLSIWQPTEADVTAPPVFPQYRNIGGFIPISDVSFGGFCAVTRFPAVNSVLRRGLIDDRAKIYLPMQPVFDVGVEVRWFKRIKEHVRDPNNAHAFMRSYRFGLEFISQSDFAKTAIRKFLQQLSQAGAI